MWAITQEFGRAAGLRLNAWEVRVRAVVAAGVPAKMYGTGAARPTAVALRAAHGATLLVVLRARLRAPPEAVSCALGVLWRADPAAVPAIGPWAMLWRLVCGPAPSARPSSLTRCVDGALRASSLLAQAAVQACARLSASFGQTARAALQHPRATGQLPGMASPQRAFAGCGLHVAKKTRCRREGHALVDERALVRPAWGDACPCARSSRGGENSVGTARIGAFGVVGNSFLQPRFVEFGAAPRLPGSGRRCG